MTKHPTLRAANRLAASILLAVTAAGRLHAQEEINVALAKWGATAAASSVFGPGYEPERALDGKASGEHEKWNAASGATPHWLLVDLGQPRTIHKVVVRHEGVRGQGNVYNTGAFQVQRAESPQGPWTDLVPPVADNRENVSTLTCAPTPVRHLRLFITKGEQGGRNEYARIFELEAYAARSTLTTPLAGFDWAAPAQYRKAGAGMEQQAVLDLVAAAGGGQEAARVEVANATALELAPGAWNGRHAFWVPQQAGVAVEAVLKIGGKVLARQRFAPSGLAYFFNGGTIEIVSSSHQDTAWMDTPDFCRRFRIEQNILPALEMMAKDPTYCFAMECTLHLMEFLEAHPERRDEIVRLMKAGRLEFGATYNQPYESYLSGEELVRQAYYGRRWIRKNLPGCDARVAFNPDVPGRALQMQQILAKAGIPYMFISRYHEGFYRWLSPDGTGILAYTPGHYGNPMALLHRPPAAGVDGIRAKLDEQGAYYQKRGIPPAYCLINSMDFSRPMDFRPLIAAWNAQTNAADAPRPPVMSYGSIAGFFDRLSAGQARFDTVTGERPDVWLYIHGPTHHWTTSARREAARLLPAAETFSTVACALDGSFKTYPAKALEQAWMDEIYIDHGIGGKNGHITDEVFHRKVANARDTGRALLDKALGAIAAKIRTDPGRGTPVTVFNTLAWTRSDPVTWEVPAGLAGPLRVTDADGRAVPSQLSTLGVPTEVNVAAAAMGAQATSSSVFGPDYGAEKAIDGCWAVRDTDPALGKSEKWNSAAGAGPHVLTVDFGQPRTIHRVVIRHEGCMGAFQEETRANTADFQVQGAAAAEGPWTDLVPPVAGNTAALTVHTFAPRTVRCLRLHITKGAQAGAGPARIYELQAFTRCEPRAARLLFVATDVPPLGYRTYYVARDAAAKPAQGPAGVRADGCENDFYRVTLAPGGIRGLYDKALGRELLQTDRFLGGEVFTMLSVAPNNRGAGTDAGEFGAAPQPVMDDSFDRVARRQPAWKLLEAGPVRTVYGLELPWRNTTVRQRVAVWNGVKRVDCEVDLADFDGALWREFRLALPLALTAPAVTYEVPMGVVQIGRDEVPTTGGHAYGSLNYHEPCSAIRPRELQNFVDASDAEGGLTLSSDVSVFDWQDPTTNAPARVMLQPVLLASRKSCNGEGNWYPQAGDHRYRFSLTSHKGDWTKGWRPGVAANHPLEAVTGAPAAPGAQLPAAQAFLALSLPNATVCTVKKAEDDDSVVVRLVEMEGRDSRAALEWFQPVQDARQATIIEEDAGPADSRGRTLKLPLGHHAIETMKFPLGQKRTSTP